MLSSFEITNFRTFSHLRIERLGRVNLIVGKNNVGKTTLLEALRLYGSFWPPGTVQSILDERNEVRRSPDGGSMLLLHCLFQGRNPKPKDVITIGQTGTGENVFCATADFEVERQGHPEGLTTADSSTVGRQRLTMQSGPLKSHLYRDGHFGFAIWDDPFAPWKVPDRPFDPPCLRSVGAEPSAEDRVAEWWDAVVVAQAEDKVADAIQLLAPIRDVAFVGDPRCDRGRIAVAGVQGLDERMPLATLGDGVVRMFHLGVALQYAAVYAKRASEGKYRPNVFPLLLIDEVESGIHYTLHADLWRFILNGARLLGVQVFATTHSWDCLEGFAQAVRHDEENDGLVIRLEKVEGEHQTGAVIIDRDALPVVVRDSIEVR